MKVSDFDYELPEELIAQTPLKNRSESRMMVIHTNTKQIEHKMFSDILSYFHEGDVIVRNNTKVIPARLFGTKQETNAHVEVLLLRQEEDDIWQCLVGNAKTIKEGTKITFHENLLEGECVEVLDEGLRRIKMIYDGVFNEILDELGQVPLPPYIKEKLDDPDRYQTIYAKVRGSAAAPTAGLHFTDEIFDALKEKGVIITDVTLHVGLGTFRPIKVDNLEDHDMHAEVYEMSKECADILNQAKKEKRRIFAIGTTSVRTLESVYNLYGKFEACNHETKLFIYPGYEWHTIDGMLTNFHLPKSTLIMMIASYIGMDLCKEAYKEAVEERYRFFSFGDCMLITNE